MRFPYYLFFFSRRVGCARSKGPARENLQPLFETISTHIPPTVDKKGSFRFLATLLEYDSFVGRILTGRIDSGRVSINMPDSAVKEQGKITKIMTFRGLNRVPVVSAEAD